MFERVRLRTGWPGRRPARSVPHNYVREMRGEGCAIWEIDDTGRAERQNNRTSEELISPAYT
jgi:hypothetical protein